MKYAPSAAYVLHTRRFRETSMLVELMTELHGRISVVARGAASGKSSYRYILQPANRLMVTASGKTELLSLNLAEEFPRLEMRVQLPYDALFSLTYLNELLIKCTAKFDPHPDIYQDYETTLSRLADPSVPLEWSLRWFEYRLLTQLGVMSDFSYIVETAAPPQVDRWYNYHPEVGLCELGRYDALVAPLISGVAIESLLCETPLDVTSDTDGKAAASLKRLMRRMIDIACPSGLKSRAVMREAWQLNAQQNEIK